MIFPWVCDHTFAHLSIHACTHPSIFPTFFFVISTTPLYSHCLLHFHVPIHIVGEELITVSSEDSLQSPPALHSRAEQSVQTEESSDVSRGRSTTRGGRGNRGGRVSRGQGRGVVKPVKPVKKKGHYPVKLISFRGQFSREAVIEGIHYFLLFPAACYVV